MSKLPLKTRPVTFPPGPPDGEGEPIPDCLKGIGNRSIERSLALAELWERDDTYDADFASLMAAVDDAYASGEADAIDRADALSDAYWRDFEAAIDSICAQLREHGRPIAV